MIAGEGSGALARARATKERRSSTGPGAVVQDTGFGLVFLGDVVKHRKGVSNPEAYCPVCSKRVGREQQGHQCSRATLAAIDAADTRAANAENEAEDVFGHPGTRPSLDARLAEGFRMLRAGGDYE